MGQWRIRSAWFYLRFSSNSNEWMNAWKPLGNDALVQKRTSVCCLSVEQTLRKKGKPLDDMLLRFSSPSLIIRWWFNVDFVVLDVRLVGNWSSLRVMMKLNIVHNRFLQVGKDQRRKWDSSVQTFAFLFIVHILRQEHQDEQWVFVFFFPSLPPSNVFISLVWSGLSSTSASFTSDQCRAHAELFNSIYDLQRLDNTRILRRCPFDRWYLSFIFVLFFSLQTQSVNFQQHREQQHPVVSFLPPSSKIARCHPAISR